MQSQLVQTPNSKLPVLPVYHLFQLRKLGEITYDSTKEARKLAKIERKYDRKISRSKSSKKQSKFRSKKIKKVEKLTLKLKDGNQLMRWGEKLIVFDSSKAAESKQNITNYVFNKGFFNGEVNLKVKLKNHRAKALYTITEHKPYYIDSLIYDIKDPDIKKIFEDHLENHVFLGKRYNQDQLTEERERVFDLLSNSGYFNFKRAYILFEVDSTTLSDHKLLVRETIANPPGQSKHHTYKLDSIIITTESGLSQSSTREITTHNNITFLFKDNKYPKRLLSWRVFLEKDSLYSKRLTLETQKQLSYLDIFKFVNINYDSTGGKFNANIFTSPLKKFQTSTEVGLSMLDEAQGLPGPFFNFNAKSRNVFGGLEIIQLDGNASIQGIQSVNNDNTQYSRLQFGGELSVTFPQFLFPLKESKRSAIGRFNPKTKIGTGINFEERRGEYERTTMNTGMSYLWQLRDNSQFTFKPFEVGYINSDNTDMFNQRLSDLSQSGYQSLVNAFQSSFVSFTSVQASYNINNYGMGNTDATYIQGLWEVGGTLQSLLGGQPFGSELEYYKYMKAGFDVRRNHKLSSKSTLAYRLNIGAAYTYGSSQALPYEKYYFAGGSNSIRAWQPRRLGPGAFASYDEKSTPSKILVDYTFERVGDIILESSIEYRADLIGFIDYAFFLDAGNIWLWKSNTIDPSEDGFEDKTIENTEDDGVFNFSSFPREIAVGAGFGFRFDFSFLVLRLDLAYKVIDPAYPLGERFVIKDFQLNDLWKLEGLESKGAFNIGIGYPF